MIGKKNYTYLTKDQPYQRQSPPTDATETASESKQESSSPLGATTCSHPFYFRDIRGRQFRSASIQDQKSVLEKWKQSQIPWPPATDAELLHWLEQSPMLRGRLADTPSDLLRLEGRLNLWIAYGRRHPADLRQALWAGSLGGFALWDWMMDIDALWEMFQGRDDLWEKHEDGSPVYCERLMCAHRRD